MRICWTHISCLQVSCLQSFNLVCSDIFRKSCTCCTFLKINTSIKVWRLDNNQMRQWTLFSNSLELVILNFLKFFWSSSFKLTEHETDSTIYYESIHRVHTCINMQAANRVVVVPRHHAALTHLSLGRTCTHITEHLNGIFQFPLLFSLVSFHT